MRYLKFIRLPNLFTAAADPWAGYFVCLSVGNQPGWGALVPLLLASACLYAAGISVNDIHDLDWDREHHPHRPLPSDGISLRNAWILVIVLVAAATGCSLYVGQDCFFFAIGLLVCIGAYVRVSKTLPLVAGLLMGACRGLNFLLGAAAVPGGFNQALLPALFFSGYIFAITLISSREEGGATSRFLWMMFSIVVLSLAGSSVRFLRAGPWPGLGPLLILSFLLLRKVHAASRELSAPSIGQIIRIAVLGVVLFDSAQVLGAGHTTFGLLCLLFLVPPVFLSRWFAMT